MNGSPNTSVGEYQLLGEVARGGQGAVYRALRADGAQVALKLLLDLDPESLARFEREALGLARLQHPNVVRVHEFGREGHKPYLVMEWIEGETLSERVRRQGPLSPPDAVQILGEVASALSHCHSLGIVHRDLKPQNVVLPAERGAVLVDFGLVRQVGSGGGELAQRLTVTGEVLGTPSYMAPEQADARFGEVTCATDVYALGATLYFALTGSPPLDLAGGLLVALVELLEGVPPDPRARQPEVPDALAALCLRSLAKRQDERPPDAGVFLAELRGSLTHAAPPVWRWWAAGVIALLAASVVTVFYLQFRVAAPLSSSSPEAATKTSATRAPDAPDVRASGTSRANPSGAPKETVARIREHLVFKNRDQAWELTERALAKHPQDPELLTLGLLALQGRESSHDETIFDLLCRLQALAPTEKVAIRIGRALRAHALGRPALGAEEERLARAIEAMESAFAQGAGPLTQDLRAELGSAYVRRADLHFQAQRWRSTIEAAARAEAILSPGVKPGSASLGRLARAIELQCTAALKRGSQPRDFATRLEEAVTKLEALCALSPDDTTPHESLARTYSYASNEKGLGLATRLARAEGAAAAFLAAHQAAPERRPARDNYKVFAFVQQARCARLRKNFPQAVEILQAGFSLSEMSPKSRKGTLTKAYLAAWGARLRWRGEGNQGREALRQVLAERPWASERDEDRDWVAELEGKLQALLERG